jgi:hypothetical protein
MRWFAIGERSYGVSRVAAVALTKAVKRNPLDRTFVLHLAGFNSGVTLGDQGSLVLHFEPDPRNEINRGTYRSRVRSRP